MDRRSPLRLSLPSRRDLRWGSGVILLAYAAAHLVNHALGLVSLATAEAALRAAAAVWHSLAGSVLLYGAAAVHVGLAALALWERRSLRMPPMEALRLLLGFSLPLLLAAHLTAMRWAYQAYGIDPSYARVVRGLWSLEGSAFQLTMMCAAWAHGCLGLHLALRARPGYRRQFHWLFAAALLLPALAALGFLAMGRELQWTAVAPLRPPSEAQGLALDATERGARWLYALALAALLAARFGRGWYERLSGRPSIELRYPQRTVRVPRGWSVLEASRAHGIAHLSMCGGRARCSTCRVQVLGPASLMDRPGRDERRTLERVRAPQDVRLACQLRPRGDLAVTPLFAPSAPGQARRLGRERDVAILFVDLRRWSGLSERQWPVDLAYVLDRYFALVGAAVREAGGLPNQFIGDSVMAIFGLDTDLPAACRQAVRATELIGERMDAWNQGFQAQFGQRLDFGMGLHAGRAAVGEVGYQDTTSFTAIGEVVNTASRLQDHSKVAAARLVISVFAARQAGLEHRFGEAQTITVRGRTEPLEVLHLAPPPA
ncbi:adenylate/guanylate cyclase domain-containing protein [Variovorax terrae]|uniref:Adenylate/guanylate cyclase domain-containing protein n=1 Tax=Variovorax terrae TaxID=2923278 RepID=A0A9X1W4B6_9BURK|nr:adenylate/guanylate cyclase domain-containing protein [Variovorax terrae]MCJ0765578.1 adenylate/guanylate cyclase domain-containing protein [Variovorax terrae]